LRFLKKKKNGPHPREIGDILAVFDARSFQVTTSQKLKKKKITISEARPLIMEQEINKLLDPDEINKRALETVDQDGIVFIDEIDKICERSDRYYGGDASAEGVQRDLLPIVEGTVIQTKIGNVDTSKMLFICSGAFHSVKPSDLIAELQGRLPVRVELKALFDNDFYRILTEPDFNLIHQQVQMMKVEGIDLQFTDKSLLEISRITCEINTTVENIGARRLHTVLEKILEDLNYNVEDYVGQTVVIDDHFVRSRLKSLLDKTDLSKFIL